MKKVTMLLCAAAAAISFSAGSAELVLVGGQSKAGGQKVSTAISLDIFSEGDVRGFDAIIPLPKGVKADTSQCLANLPAGFVGRCAFSEGEVAIIAVAQEKITLPHGVNSIGKILLSGGAVSKSMGVKFNFVDIDGKESTSIAKVEL